MNKTNKLEYPSGLPGIGIPGKKGVSGDNGYSFYFTNRDASKDDNKRDIINNIKLGNSIIFDTPDNTFILDRPYKNNDYIIDITSNVYIINIDEDDVKLLDTGYKYNSQNIFIKDTLMTSDNEYLRYHNQFFGDAKFVVDNIYTDETTNLQDIYNKSVYGVKLSDFSSVNIYDNMSKAIKPFQVFTDGINSVAIIYDTDNKSFRFGCASTTDSGLSVDDNIIMQFDCKSFELPEDTTVGKYKVLTYAQYNPGDYLVDDVFKTFSSSFKPDFSNIGENIISIKYELDSFFDSSVKKPTGSDLRVNFHINEVAPVADAAGVINVQNYGSNNFIIYDVPLSSNEIKLKGLSDKVWITYIEFIDQKNGWTRSTSPIHINQSVVNANMLLVNNTIATDNVENVVVEIIDSKDKTILYNKTIATEYCSRVTEPMPINLVSGDTSIENVDIKVSTTFNNTPVEKLLANVTRSYLSENRFLQCWLAKNNNDLSIELEMKPSYVDVPVNCPTSTVSFDLKLVNKTNLPITCKSLKYKLSHLTDNGLVVDGETEEFSAFQECTLQPYMPCSILFTISGVMENSYITIYCGDGELLVDNMSKHIMYTTDIIDFNRFKYTIKDTKPAIGDANTIKLDTSVSELYLSIDKSSDAGFVSLNNKDYSTLSPTYYLFKCELSKRLNLYKENIGLFTPSDVTYVPDNKDSIHYGVTDNYNELSIGGTDDDIHKRITPKKFITTLPDMTGELKIRTKVTPFQTLLPGCLVTSIINVEVKDINNNVVYRTTSTELKSTTGKLDKTITMSGLRVSNIGEYSIEVYTINRVYNPDSLKNYRYNYELNIIYEQAKPTEYNYIKLNSRFQNYISIPSTLILNDKRWDIKINSSKFITFSADNNRIDHKKFYYLSKNTPLIIQSTGDAGFSLSKDNNMNTGNRVCYSYPNYELMLHNYLALNGKVIKDYRNFPTIGSNDVAFTTINGVFENGTPRSFILSNTFMCTQNIAMEYNFNIAEFYDIVPDGADVELRVNLKQMSTRNGFVLGNIHYRVFPDSSNVKVINKNDLKKKYNLPVTITGINTLDDSEISQSVLLKIEFSFSVTHTGEPLNITDQNKFISIDNILGACTDLSEGLFDNSNINLYNIDNWVKPSVIGPKEYKFRLEL